MIRTISFVFEMSRTHGARKPLRGDGLILSRKQLLASPVLPDLGWFWHAEDERTRISNAQDFDSYFR